MEDVHTTPTCLMQGGSRPRAETLTSSSSPVDVLDRMIVGRGKYCHYRMSSSIPGL